MIKKLMVVLLLFLVPSSSEAATVKADFIFFIDSTGSMSNYIDSVRANLISFADYLEENNVDIRFSVIEFKDVTEDGATSTIKHTFGDSEWTSDTSLVQEVLANIVCSGGGDEPETPIDALLKVNHGSFREDASRFAFLLTDASSKNITIDGEICDLEDIVYYYTYYSIYTTVISQAQYKEDYNVLYSQTGGIFIDINSPNYYELMLTVADWVIEQAKDSDSDGLPDIWEINGIDIDGDESIDIDLPAMGANPNSPDIFVELDYMYRPSSTSKFLFWTIPIEKEINLKPSEEALNVVRNKFMEKGIHLHIDSGRDSVMDLRTGKKWGELSRSDAVPYSAIFPIGDRNAKEWNRFAVDHFARNRWHVFRYCVFVDKIEGIENNTGLTITPGQFILVADTNKGNGILKSKQKTAGTFMHELGHSLGLRHGGDEDVNYKPNYLSVMSYLYQFTGLVGTNEINYSEYVLPRIDQNHLDETKGLDPDSRTRGKPLGAKWRTGEDREVNAYGHAPSPSRAYNGIAGQPIDFDKNNRIETNVRVNFYMEDDNKEKYEGLINPSINDWDNLIFRGGSIGGLGAILSVDDVPILISVDIEDLTTENITLKEAEELGLTGNPDDCDIVSIMPDILYSSVPEQKFKITVANLFNTDTTAGLEVKSDLLDAPFKVSLDLEGKESTDVLIPVKRSISVGDYEIKCVLTCANYTNSDIMQTVHVINNEPFTVEEGANLTVDSTLFGGYTPSIDDTSIATMSGTVIHGEEAGQTFMVLRDTDDSTICTIPVFVVRNVNDEPEPTPNNNGNKINSSGGGCNSALLGLLAVSLICVFKRRS